MTKFFFALVMVIDFCLIQKFPISFSEAVKALEGDSI